MTKMLSALIAGLCVLFLGLGASAARDGDNYDRVAKKQTEAEKNKAATAACNKLRGSEKKRCLKNIPVKSKGAGGERNAFENLA